jgi:hypothetical protein
MVPKRCAPQTAMKPAAPICSRLNDTTPLSYSASSITGSLRDAHAAVINGPRANIDTMAVARRQLFGMNSP